MNIINRFLHRNVHDILYSARYENIINWTDAGYQEKFVFVYFIKYYPYRNIKYVLESNKKILIHPRYPWHRFYWDANVIYSDCLKRLIDFQKNNAKIK